MSNSAKAGPAGAALGLLLGAMVISPAQAETVTISEPGLQPYTIVDYAVPEPLTEKPGDPVAGKQIFVHRKKGNCLTCHTAPIPEEQFHGTVGPDLQGVADRMTEAQMRLRIVNPRYVNPETTMIPMYTIEPQVQVKDSFEGKAILTAQEVEDVIAYLMTLKGSGKASQ